MDAQVNTAVVLVRKLGNIPESLVSFFNKEVPAVTLGDSVRLAILRFKTDKEAKTKRENMAVLSPKFEPDNFGAKPDHDFLQSLIHDYHDGLLVRAANGEITWDQATSQDFMVKDYSDNSRSSSGRTVTKETIAAWFNANLADTIKARALAKNAQMQAEALSRVVTGYCEMFQKFTKYDLVNTFTEVQTNLLRTIMVEASAKFVEDDEIAEYILTKLSKIAELRMAQDDLLSMI